MVFTQIIQGKKEQLSNIQSANAKKKGLLVISYLIYLRLLWAMFEQLDHKYLYLDQPEPVKLSFLLENIVFSSLKNANAFSFMENMFRVLTGGSVHSRHVV